MVDLNQHCDPSKRENKQPSRLLLVGQRSPVNMDKIRPWLNKYPRRVEADTLSEGFSVVFFHYA